MSNYSKLYWLTRLDNINGFAIVIAIISIVTIAITLIWCAITSDFDEYESRDEIGKRKALRAKARGYIKSYVISFVVSLVLLIFLPTKNEVIFIVAGGKTMNFIQSDTSINKIPAQTTAIISDFLQKQIGDMNKK